MIITDITELRKRNDNASAEEAQEIIKQLEKELADSPRPGIGLSANQIGINKKVAIIRIKHENNEAENLNFVNPVIVEKYDSFICENEGCLSLPGVVVNTNRFKEIFVKDDLHPAGFVATGLAAIATQHEIDHLENILIIDRVAGKKKIGRNDKCPCGSGRKWKKCHGK